MPQPTTTDNLNEVLKNITRNRLSCVAQREQLQKQLEDVPKQIQGNIDSIDRTLREMDTMIAGIQVILTDSDALAETEKQVASNASPLPPAATGGAAAGESGATEAASVGDAGLVGVAGEPAASAASASGAQVAASEGAPASR